MPLTHDKQAAVPPPPVQKVAEPRRRARRVQWAVDEQLLWQLKTLAAKSHRSNGAELEQAILEYLQRRGVELPKTLQAGSKPG